MLNTKREQNFAGASEARHLAESSDTESADVRPKDEKRRNLPPIKLTSLFKKNKEKELTEENVDEHAVDIAEEGAKPPLAEPESLALDLRTDEKDGGDKGLVYAELDLVSPYSNMKPVVKNEEEKTEYAEILYAPKDETTKEDTKDKSKK